MNKEIAMTPIRVLIVEDVEDDALLVMGELKRNGYAPTVRRVDTAKVLSSALAEHPWDIVLADYSMPQFDALAALAIIRKADIDIPVIIVSGAIGEETAVAAMRAGANDYVMKGNLARLAPAVERELRDAEVRRQRRIADERVTRRLRLEEAMSNVSRQLVSPGDVNLNGILGIMGEAVMADRCYIFEFRDSLALMDNTFEWCAPGVRAEIAGLQSVESARLSWWMEKLKESDNIVISDVEALPAQAAPEKAIFREEGIKALLAVPIVLSQSGLHGFMGFDDVKSPRKWDSDDIRFLRVVAEMLGSYFEREAAARKLTQSREELRNLAAHVEEVREKERTQIARDIHDNLAQLLTALKMDLSQLAERVPKNPKTTETILGMNSLVDQASDSVHRVSMQLRPVMLDDLGLAAAVEWHVREFEKRTGLKTSIVIEPKDSINLDRDRSTALYRILQEALTNVIRHARASAVEIRLQQRPDEILLWIADNGRGITREQAANSRAFGLIGMRERVIAFDGAIEIAPRLVTGTSVTVKLPLKPRHEGGKPSSKETGRP
jgi:two-component system, NarL family, sensor histidine kinase UhpB